MALVGNISGSNQSNSVIGISGSVIFANRPDAEFPALPPDASFFVSGSTGGVDKAVFGGDLVVSGSVDFFGDSVEITGSLNVLGPVSLDGPVLITNDLTVTGTLKDQNGVTRIDLNDGSNNVVVYQTDGTTPSAIFGAGGLSGSLTQLTNGTSYLIAGDNISIDSGSNYNGAILISSTLAPAESYWFSSQQDVIYTTGSIQVTGSAIFDTQGRSVNDIGADVYFFVSGSLDGTNRSLFGGDLIVSGNILPGLDNTKNLGSPTQRWSNVYTGDLHLKNERGDWTLIEEKEYLTIRDNFTGKRYKLMMAPLEED